ETADPPQMVHTLTVVGIVAIPVAVVVLLVFAAIRFRGRIALRGLLRPLTALLALAWRAARRLLAFRQTRQPGQPPQRRRSSRRHGPLRSRWFRWFRSPPPGADPTQDPAAASDPSRPLPLPARPPSDSTLELPASGPVGSSPRTAARGRTAA